MKKFSEIVALKEEAANKINEERLRNEFSLVYKNLLESYRTISLASLSEDNQNAFKAELNRYFDNEKGITNEGVKFVKENSYVITESSTKEQIEKTLSKRIESKFKTILECQHLDVVIFEAVDEIMKETNSKELKDLNTDKLSDVITKATNEALNNYLSKPISIINESL